MPTPQIRNSARPSFSSSNSSISRLIQPFALLLSGQGARAGYLAAIDQGVISVTNFIATILLARNVSPTELGIYGVGFVAIRLVRALQEGLIVQPLNVFGAGMTAGEFKRYATSTAIIQLVLAGAISLGVAFAGWFLTLLGNDTAGPAMFALWFTFFAWQMHEYLRRTLYTRGAILSAAINTVIANSIRLGIMLFWAAKETLTGIGGLDAIAWGSLLTVATGLWFTRQYWGGEPAPIMATAKQNWVFGRWMMGGLIANWVAVEFYPILTAGLISFAAAGAYRALQNLVAPIHLLLRATDTFLTPRAARDFAQNGKAALQRTMRLIYLLSGLPILGLLTLAVAFPKPLLRLLYGETYLAYSSGISLMAIFYALLFAYWPLQSGLKAARLSRPIFIANMTAFLAMFAFGIPAIRKWDVYGAIVGQALNALIVGLILWAAWFLIPKPKDST